MINKELNRRMRSISPDNFFKYKDFYGSKPETITDSPTRVRPSLKQVFEQKVAAFHILVIRTVMWEITGLKFLT